MARHKKPSGTYHHGDLREALLSEALKLVDQRGSSQVSLRELARRLGVSSAAPYHHFGDSNAVLRAVAQRGFDRLQACMQEELGNVQDSPGPRLRALGRGYLRFAAHHPALFKLMFGVNCPLEPPHEKSEDGKAFALLRDAVVACLRRAGRDSEDPMPSVLAMWSGVHGMAALRADGPLAALGGPDEIDRLCEAALCVLSRGLIAD